MIDDFIEAAMGILLVLLLVAVLVGVVLGLVFMVQAALA